MHPNLLKLLTPLSLEVDAFSFSDETVATIKLRIGEISCKDPIAVQFHQDNLDTALIEVTETRCQAAYSLGEVRSKIRDIESSYYKHGEMGIKEAERSINGDEEHIEFKMVFLKLEAVVKYCDSTEDLLRNKGFEIIRKAKV